MNPFRHFSDMELQRLHHAMMGVVFVSGLKDPTRMDLLEWAYRELEHRIGEEE